MEDDILLVAIDDSKQASKAIDYAVKIARASGFTIELLHVQPKVNTHYANKKIGKKQLEKYKKDMAISILSKGRNQIDAGLKVKVRWRQGITANEICKEASDVNALGIIMGSGSVKKVKGRLLGGTCNRVINNAPCPVTIVS